MEKHWFSILVGIPGFLAWCAYGIVWLIGPHMVLAGMAAPLPILWAGYIAGAYYALLAIIAVTTGGGALIL